MQLRPLKAKLQTLGWLIPLQFFQARGALKGKTPACYTQILTVASLTVETAL